MKTETLLVLNLQQFLNGGDIIMKPEMCRIKDDPENNQSGDCVRACIASLLELDAENVPHFFAEPDGLKANQDMQFWLANRRKIAAFISLPGEWSFKKFGEYMTEFYHNKYYMLWAGFGSGDHAVICKNGKIEHNPAWYRTPLTGPHSHGIWIVGFVVDL